jgi:hypothetical protein
MIRRNFLTAAITALTGAITGFFGWFSPAKAAIAPKAEPSTGFCRSMDQGLLVIHDSADIYVARFTQVLLTGRGEPVQQRQQVTGSIETLIFSSKEECQRVFAILGDVTKCAKAKLDFFFEVEPDANGRCGLRATVGCPLLTSFGSSLVKDGVVFVHNLPFMGVGLTIRQSQLHSQLI